MRLSPLGALGVTYEGTAFSISLYLLSRRERLLVHSSTNIFLFFVFHGLSSFLFGFCTSGSTSSFQDQIYAILNFILKYLPFLEQPGLPGELSLNGKMLASRSLRGSTPGSSKFFCLTSSEIYVDDGSGNYLKQ